jgi:hypothetical protein
VPPLFAIPPPLDAGETIDFDDPDNALNLDRAPDASVSSGGPSAGSGDALPPSPSRDIPMEGSATPLAPMSPGTPPGSPEKRSRAEPACSPKCSADEIDLGDQVGGLLDMPLDTPHELDILGIGSRMNYLMEWRKTVHIFMHLVMRRNFNNFDISTSTRKCRELRQQDTR